MSFEPDSDGILRLAAWNDVPWLLHGFTTRTAGDFANGTPDAGAIQRLGADGLTLQTVRQVHSNKVQWLSGGHSPWDSTQRPEADALVSALPGYILGVRTADCLPLLLVDRRNHAVAAVHAGWRGVKQQIARGAVEIMRARVGSRPQDLEVAIGPGIAACCFEVGPEVAEQFDASLVVTPARKSGGPGSKRNPKEPRPHVDLVEANRRQLLECGIPARSIWSSERCTCCQEADFYSYRRDGDTARMLAFVGIRQA